MNTTGVLSERERKQLRHRALATDLTITPLRTETGRIDGWSVARDGDSLGHTCRTLIEAKLWAEDAFEFCGIWRRDNGFGAVRGYFG